MPRADSGYPHESLLKSVQNIATSGKLKRKKEIRKFEIQMKKQKKSYEQKRIPRETAASAKHYQLVIF